MKIGNNKININIKFDEGTLVNGSEASSSFRLILVPNN